MSYAAELTAIKRVALHTLFEVLKHAKDHAELRRAATAILRIPDPKPEPQESRATDSSATGCRGSARQPVPTTPDARISQDTPPQSDNTGDAEFPPEPESDFVPVLDSAFEPEGLIVSSPGVQRGSANNTPGHAHANESHPDGVLGAPALATTISISRPDLRAVAGTG